MPDVGQFFKDAAIQVGSGGSAGFVEVCIMHPLDVVKTRLQLQAHFQANSSQHYAGILDCFGKIRKYEGVFAFWKGVCAGITEAFFVNPFEVVKVNIQSDKRHIKELPSTWVTAKAIITKNGYGGQGLYRGISATAIRNGVFNGIYFGLYHSLKGKLQHRNQSPTMDLLYKLGLGFTSGVLGSCFNIPFDVAKSRIQGPQPVPGQIKYSTTFGTIRTVYIEEGWRALFKGLLPKVMRLGPGGAIMLVVYEHVHSYLTLTFAN